jgi:uncharacterized protein YbjQ (UPF0145 family)
MLNAARLQHVGASEGALAHGQAACSSFHDAPQSVEFGSRAAHIRPSQRSRTMIVATTSTLDGRPVKAYLGVVSGEAVIGANIFRDLFAGIRDVIGGRSGSYEQVFKEARETALNEMMAEAKKLGADAVIGVDIDYEAGLGQGTMMMVACSGTAVKLG